MKELIYDPIKSGRRMTIVFFVSGSGTNYREIVKRDPDHDYLVFSNRPECGALKIANEFHHRVVVLSHIPYLKEARLKFGSGRIPADCSERLTFEQEAVRLIESSLERHPDIICLAGYDLWYTSWFIDKFYPSIINIHPGDTIKGYAGLHWIPAARAIIAGEQTLRSTAFIVDRGGDTGPVIAQSTPLFIGPVLEASQKDKKNNIISKFGQVQSFITFQGILNIEDFNSKASPELKLNLEEVCQVLQNVLKAAGDWKIYPFVIHDLIARGRVALEGRQVFVDDHPLPPYGYRFDCGG